MARTPGSGAGVAVTAMGQGGGMRAVGVTTFGGPQALTLLEVPQTHAGPGEVRLRVAYAAVNPTDTALREGRYGDRMQGTEPPFVPGMDVSGTVDEVGDGVTHVSVGDEVMGIVSPRGAHGGYRESLVLPGASVVTLPQGCDLAHGATLPMNAMTARLTLDALALAPGQTLAVTGAAGAYGGYVVELAKTAGLVVIADASEADVELVRSLGADHVVARGDDVAERIREIVPAGVDGLADGAVQNQAAAAAVRDGGGFATVRRWAEDAGRGITVHSIWVFGAIEDTARLTDLRDAVSAGTLTPRVAQVFPAAEAADAHRLLAQGGVRGRLLIDFT